MMPAKPPAQSKPVSLMLRHLDEMLYVAKLTKVGLRVRPARVTRYGHSIYPVVKGRVKIAELEDFGPKGRGHRYYLRIEELDGAASYPFDTVLDAFCYLGECLDGSVD